MMSNGPPPSPSPSVPSRSELPVEVRLELLEREREEDRRIMRHIEGMVKALDNERVARVAVADALAKKADSSRALWATIAAVALPVGTAIGWLIAHYK